MGTLRYWFLLIWLACKLFLYNSRFSLCNFTFNPARVNEFGTDHSLFLWLFLWLCRLFYNQASIHKLKPCKFYHSRFSSHDFFNNLTFNTFLTHPLANTYFNGVWVFQYRIALNKLNIILFFLLHFNMIFMILNYFGTVPMFILILTCIYSFVLVYAVVH